MKFNQVARDATLHCLTGCAIGEVVGMVISTAFNWHNVASIVFATVLAFVFGYSFTFVPLVRSGTPLSEAARIAVGGDTVSITVMELVDNAIVVAVPGAMDAGLADLLFWASLAIGLLLAGIAAYPVNVWLVTSGRRGHAAHGHH